MSTTFATAAAQSVEPATIVEALDAITAADPAALLYTFHDSRGRVTASFDRAGFQRRAAGIAAELAALPGWAVGDRVILAYPAGLEMIAAFFGTMRAGGIPVPVPPLGKQSTRHRIDQVAGDCSARAVLTVGSGSYPALPTFDSSLWPDAVPEPPRAAPDGIAFLQYTSGSTSAPRGVRVTHRNLLHNGALVVDHPRPVAVNWLPQHHDMGLIGYCLYPALAGGVMHGLAPEAFVARPKLWLELITRYQATASSAPGFAFDHLLDRLQPGDLDEFDMSSMRFLMAAAEPIRPETYARFLNATAPLGLDPSAFYVAYGLAEATLAVTSYGRRRLTLGAKDLARGQAREAATPAAVAAGIRVMSCGLPLGDTQVAIVGRGSSAGTTLPPGKVGEVWLAGDSICPGYWVPGGRDAFSKKLEGSDAQWLATGDLGFLDQGELVICGRAKDLIIVRGQNLYPQDIEASIARALGLRPEVVAAVERDGEVLAVAECPGRAKPDPLAAVRQVRVDLGIELAELLLVPPRTLPRTSSGKLRRHLVAALPDTPGLKVIAHWRRAASAAGDAPFSWLRERYQLDGTESQNLADIGVESLDLVGLLHEIQELLVEHGASRVAEGIDARLVQRLAVRDLMAIADSLECDPAGTIAQLASEFADAAAEVRAAELAAMAADAARPPPVMAAAGPVPGLNDGPVLLSGATGFLGPFLIASLLAQTTVPVIALVRAADAAEGQRRLLAAAEATGLDRAVQAAMAERVEVVPADVARPDLGLDTATWTRLANEVASVFHNAALVNYLFDYGRMQPANVQGTDAMLELAARGRRKVFNHVSTTFIFGWATKPFLLETDGNAEMALLDFGYSQTKWASEQRVLRASETGLPMRMFRPALITPSLTGGGNAIDITIRLLKFMMDHGIGVDALNQVSFTPVDLVANNIVAIAGLEDTLGGNFHVVRDDFSSMADVTDCITATTGRPFTQFPLKGFVPEVLRRATRDDLLFPLLDFLINSIDNIASMEFKRYDSTSYQAARDRSPWGRPDPSLPETVSGILAFMNRQGLMRY